MSDDLQAAIHALQAGDDPPARRAFAAIAAAARREPGECAAALSRAALAERDAGALRTLRLLTLLGLTREPAPACVPLCLDLLRASATAGELPPTDALLGAAAIVARTQPRALLPDLAALGGDPQAAQEVDRELAQALPLLLAITSGFLRELPDSAVADMARRLWSDCAAFDLLTLADFAGLQAERAGPDDPIVALMADLIERTPATDDQKRYAGQRLQEAGAAAAVIERLKNAWRATRVAPAPAAATPAVADPAPPPPDPRVDEWLAAFSDAEGDRIELMRAAVDEMFEGGPPPPALAWWLALTVDALPPRRRRTDIRWALLQIVAALRRHGGAAAPVPPSVLRRWLDSPQLLDDGGTRIALELLSRQQPHAVAQRDLHRVVAASSEPGAERLMRETWRALVAAEPAAVLRVASRWIAFGFGQGAFLDLLLDLLIGRARAQPALVDALADALAPAPDMPAEAIDIARELVARLREPPPEDRPS